jgi:hypothetical protein
MADLIYNNFSYYLGDGTIDLDDDTLYIALFTDSHVPSAGAVSYNDLENEVANGNGYTTGGLALSSVTWTQSDSVSVLDADDPSWTSSSFTARYAVIYDFTTANNINICLYDFGSNQTVTNGTFTVRFNASGILQISTQIEEQI